jgi:hypothetical protein
MKRLDPETTLTVALIAVLAITVAWPAFAERSDGRRERRGPPAVAIEACTDAAAGDSCSFIGRRDDELTGTCESRREMIVCVPEGHDARHRQRGGDRGERE